MQRVDYEYWGASQYNYRRERPEFPPILGLKLDCNSYEQIKAHKQLMQGLALYDFYEEEICSGDVPMNTYCIKLYDLQGIYLEEYSIMHDTKEESIEEAQGEYLGKYPSTKFGLCTAELEDE